MSETVCRWGILGTAGIARKIWKAIQISGNGQVVAVASRSESRAQTFIDQCASEVPFANPIEALESYEALFNRADIDAVYIPLPTGLRKPWVIAAARAGKHVLCEKPVAVHTADAREMIDACAQAGVQFMDGVMFDHSDRMQEIHRRLRDEQPIGKLRRIHTHFSFRGDEAFRQSNIRTDAALEPHGALGDLGWYCIRFALWISDLRLPSQVSARTLAPLRGSDSAGEVPGEFSAEMFYQGGLTASFYCSFLTANQQTATVSGEDGYLTLEDFVLPFYDSQVVWAQHRHELEIDNCRWNFCRRSQGQAVPEYAAGEPNAQEVKMVRKLGEIASSRGDEAANSIDPLHPELTLKTQQILDACRRSDAAGGQLISL